MSNENNYSSNETQDTAAYSNPNTSSAQQTVGETEVLQNFYSPMDEPPKKKKKWPVVAGIAGAVVIAGGAAGAYWHFFRTPSFETPTEAITTCMSQLGEQFSSKNLGVTALEEKLDTKTMLEEIADKGYSTDISLKLEDSSMEELSMLKGMSFGLSLASDVKNQTSSGSIEASMLGMGGDLRFYSDSDKITLTSKEFLPDSYLSLSMKELTDKLKASMSEEELDQITSMLEQQSSTALTGLTDFSEYVTKQLPDSLVSFAKDWDIEKTKENDSVKIGSEKYDCYTYDVSISSKDFQKFVEDYCSYLSEYDYDNNELFKMIEESYASQTGEEISAGDLITQGLEALPDSIDGSDDETLYVTFNIAPKGQLLGVACDIAGDDNNNLNVSMLFGGENPGQEYYFTMDGEIDGETINYELSSTTSTKKGTDTTDISLSCTLGSEMTMDMKAASNYDSDTDDFNSSVSFSLDADGEQGDFNLTSTGSYKDIEKGKGYTISYDSFAFNGTYGDYAIDFEFSGDTSFSVLQDAVKEPSGTEFDVLNLSDTDIEQILSELKKSSLLSALLSDVTTDDISSMIQSFTDSLSSYDFENGLTNGFDEDSLLDDAYTFDEEDASDDDADAYDYDTDTYGDDNTEDDTLDFSFLEDDLETN